MLFIFRIVIFLSRQVFANRWIVNLLSIFYFQTPAVTNKDEEIKPKLPSQTVKNDAIDQDGPVKPKPITNKPDIQGPKPIPGKSPKPVPKPKPSSFVKSSASLPRITGNSTSLELKSSTLSSKFRSEATKKTAEPDKSQQGSKSSFEGVKNDKCIICGRAVYQMEKCKFDDSVMHRNCIKCFVCKRHLTVGNFVLTESKIYCKPHSRTAIAVTS